MKVAPSSGESAVRLMWSLMSTGVPGFQVSRMPPAPFVRIMVVAPVGGRRAHRVHDAAHAVVLVVVGAGADDEGALAARQQHRAQRADVADEGGLREAGDLIRGDGRGGLADEVGGLRPAAAEGEGDVVLVDAGLLGDLRRGLRGDVEGVGRGVVEGIGMPPLYSAARRRSLSPASTVLPVRLGVLRGLLGCRCCPE